MNAKELFYRKLLHRVLWALGISCAINIFLFSFLVKELDNASLSFSSTNAQNESRLPFATAAAIQNELEVFKAYDFDTLVSLLDDSSAKSDGYTVRDCALSVLVTKHHFYIEKALNPGLQKRYLLIKDETFTLFPALSNEHYSKIIDFIHTECFPFTLQGLFSKLKLSASDTVLQRAIKQNADYKKIQDYLTSDAKLTQDQAFTLITCADWTSLCEIKNKGRTRFLEKMLTICPKEASQALLDVDFSYALHKLDDKQVMIILDELASESKWLKDYALKQYLSPRQDEVRKKAALRLCLLANLDPAKQTKETLLSHFGITVPKQKMQQVKVSKPSERIHIVQKGENLWSIAKAYKVDVSVIRKKNNLQTDSLRPGTQLVIPAAAKPLPK